MPSLVHPKEQAYFVISLLVSISAYIGVIALAMTSIESVAVLLVYGGLGLMLVFIAKAFFIGHVRGNGIRVSPIQLPMVFESAQRMSEKMGLHATPAVFVLQSGGMINAFATRFLGRSFVILYSDVVELAISKGQAELDFIICHELAHLHRKHLMWRTVLLPANIIPLLGAAYSRACEYTCDRYGTHYVPAGAVGAMLVLAAGKHLYPHVNAHAFAQQSATETGLWVWYAEKCASHPHLTKRTAEVVSFLAGTNQNTAAYSATQGS
ncbi:MAG TPA: M48 family metallopeptidase [Clostridia bacterium]|nr:M48 family metallopeptidase [Clostridia bacterium]